MCAHTTRGLPATPLYLFSILFRGPKLNKFFCFVASILFDDDNDDDDLGMPLDK